MNQSILCMKFLASPLPFDVTGILLNYPINDDKKCNYKCIPQQSFTTYPASLPPKSHHTVRPPRRRASFQSVFCALRKACHVLSHAMWGHGDDRGHLKENMETRFFLKIEVMVTYKVNGSWIFFKSSNSCLKRMKWNY